MYRLLALALLAASPFVVHSETDISSGNALLTQCSAAVRFNDGERDVDVRNAWICLSYVEGYVNSIIIHKQVGKSPFCIPCEITNGQHVRVIVNYLNEHPERLHEDKSFLVMNALFEKFPCDNQSAQ